MTKYAKEERWELRYVSLKDGEVKNCYPRSEEKKNEQLKVCKEKGIKVIHCKKLYPFNTMKNQHNFDLIHTLAMNDLYDIWNGELKVTDEEYEKIESLRDRSEKYFILPLPCAWLCWDEWKDANELAQMAIVHRQNACIENGRPDLVTYC